jgi:hypothetical protein
MVTPYLCSDATADRAHRRRMSRVALAALMLILPFGCGRDDPHGAGRALESELVTLDTPGGSENVTLHRYVAPDDFPLPFTTFIPADFEARPRLDGDAQGIAFFREMERQRGDSALVYLVVLPPETDEDGARELVRTVAERVRVPGNRTELEPIRQHEWAVVEYPIRSRGSLAEPVEGWVALGYQAGRWYYLIARSKSEVWPQFGPLVERILAEWEWTGAGEGSAAGDPRPPRSGRATGPAAEVDPPLLREHG